MSPPRSAALLVYRTSPDGTLEVLLAHMGGPFWARKDEGAWTVPKGEHEPDEAPLAAAEREFAEEMGSPPPAGEHLELGEVKQSTGKIVTTFAVRGDFDVTTFASNTFEMEWPRGSGRVQEFLECDRAAWFDLPTARLKLVKGQRPIMDALENALG